MRLAFGWMVFSCILGNVQGQGAGPTPAAAAPRSADEAWEQVSAKARTAADIKVSKPSAFVAADAADATRIKDQRAKRAQAQRGAAEAAKTFHSTYPQHAKALAARKVEVLAGLEGILPSDRLHEKAVLAVAEAFRRNPALPVADRLEVAHAIEAREVERRLPGYPWFKNPVLAESMLDRLRIEFSDRPEVWGRYLALAQHTYCDAGRDIARRIVQSDTASEQTKLAARAILERYTLVRQPLDFPVVPVQGRPTTLAALAGKTTVVCFWDGTRSPDGPPGLADQRRNPRPDTRWIYISIGALPEGPRSKKQTFSGPQGVFAAEASGWQSPLVAKVKLQSLPYVFVLDEKKNLSAYGRIDELPALFAGIGRPALP